MTDGDVGIKVVLTDDDVGADTDKLPYSPGEACT